MPGLTLTGFETVTLGEIREAISTRWREAFGASMDVSDRSPDGQLIGIFSEPPALAWEVLEAIVSSLDPDKATGALLAALCALTGTEKRPPSYSAVTLTLTGVPTTPVPAGQLVSTVSTSRQFVTLAAVTIAATVAWAGSSVYSAGDRVTNAGNVYVCTTGGTSAASPGPTGDGDGEADGSAVWRFAGEGTGDVDVSARSADLGPIVAVSGDLTQRDTPVGGWLGVINLLDAVTGRAEMTDAELRALRVLELAQPGTSPADAIRASLLSLDGVESCTVFVNNADTADGDGLPPHSIECLVQGGADQDIWDALLANVAAGIATHGTEEGGAIDASGNVQAMQFSRPDEVEIYVALDVVVDPATYPEDGDDQIRAAIVAWGAALPTGRDVTASAVLARVFDVDGVLECDLPFIGVAPSPATSATVAITTRQLAKFDTSRIDVTTTEGTP